MQEKKCFNEDAHKLSIIRFGKCPICESYIKSQGRENTQGLIDKRLLL